MCEQLPANPLCSVFHMPADSSVKNAGGGICLERFLASLGEWLFARLRKVSEASWMVKVRGSSMRGRSNCPSRWEMPARDFCSLAWTQ